MPDVKVLFTYDFPAMPFNENDVDFLGINKHSSIADIKNAFKTSKPYRWLIKTLYDTENGELYFGNLTEKLHNTLINDPKPYRKEVKDLLANLLNWIQELKIVEVTIDRPNHSQRISIKK